MGLRCLLCLLLVEALLLQSLATSPRQRRQATSDTEAYRPPISLALPAKAPVAAASINLPNSYQPPISLVRSNEYQSPLLPPGDAPRTYQVPPQTYVLQNHPHHSVQYFPSESSGRQQSFSVFQQQGPPPATSYSVHQQPVVHHQSQPASFSQSTTAERTSSKVVSSHVPAQAIHKAPASEIHQSPDKGHPSAKEKDKANDEYVVYYYYYYDNDTATNHNSNNLSLNFDDIPSLESYDADRPGIVSDKKTPRTTDLNSLTPETGTSSQPRSVDGRPGNQVLPQPLKPVSNVFRYGSNEVPRFPVLPNFIATEAPTTIRAHHDFSTPDTLTTESLATQPSLGNAPPDLKTGDEADDDDLNSVLDKDPKTMEEKIEEDPTTTTTTTTTTEAPTTTEEATTTTEKPRRRPPLGGGGRRRFNPSPSSSFSPSRNRQTPSRSGSSSTSSTSTTTASTPPRRSFQGNRIRPRPPVTGNRPRTGSRTTEATDDRLPLGPSSESTTSSASTTTARTRFTSAAPRRFQSSRSRTISSTTSTTRAPSSSSSPPRTRPAGTGSSSSSSNRPRPNLISRNRPPRPGFLRPRPGSEPEEPETTTTAAAVPAPTEQEAPPETSEDEPASTRHDDEDNNETEEDNETSAEETEEPTTTEGSRFSALFRPRNRNSLGNRPRPVIGNRPPRS